jgi:hypothetical protein
MVVKVRLFQEDKTAFKQVGAGTEVLVICEKVVAIDSLLGQSPRYLDLSII